MFIGLENIGVSVVIVTYNGKDRIKQTLEHLAMQQGVYFNWEVILVDNNSTDNTGVIAEEIWEANGSPCPLRVLIEKQAGTMYARYNGIVNANYRYLLYCDDDNWLKDTYLQIAFEKIIINHQIAAIGGCGVLEFEKDFIKPEWLSRYERNFGAGPQGKIEGDTTNDKCCLYTAGAILDRVWLDRLYTAGFKSVLKGRDGKSLLAGEDTELTYALRIMGGRLYYYSAMQFKHYMPPQRISWQYVVRLSKGFGESNYIVKGYSGVPQKRLWKDYLITLGLIVKYFIRSILKGFKEGTDDVIFYYRFLGQWNALRFAKKNNNAVIEVVKKLEYSNNQIVKSIAPLT